MRKILITRIFDYPPDAVAEVKGSASYPNINGTISFWQTQNGVVVMADVNGLPYNAENICSNSIFAMHIHEGCSCSGNNEDPFADVGAHYNPHNCMHPAHAGDLPPLFSNKGEAWMAVFTDRFSVNDVIGRAVIIHLHYDDFMTQPSGNAGVKIACGIIKRINS